MFLDLPRFTCAVGPCSHKEFRGLFVTTDFSGSDSAWAEEMEASGNGSLWIHIGILVDFR